MTATILDGQALADSVKNNSSTGGATRVTPGLGTILVGDDPLPMLCGCQNRDCEEVGIASIHEHLPADIAQQDLGCD